MMQSYGLEPFDLNSPAERGTTVVLPSGKAVMVVTEAVFVRNFQRWLSRKPEKEKQKD